MLRVWILSTPSASSCSSPRARSAHQTSGATTGRARSRVLMRAATGPLRGRRRPSPRWRAPGATPTRAGRRRRRGFRDAHQRLEALAIEAGLGPSDVVIHDLGRAELRGIWGNEEVVLVVEEIGEAVTPVSAT